MIGEPLLSIKKAMEATNIPSSVSTGTNLFPLTPIDSFSIPNILGTLGP